MTTTMGRLSAVLFLGASLAVPAGAKDLAARLRGKWLMDKDAMFEASAPPLYKLATPEKQKQIRADMMKTMPEMSFEFTADTLIMTAGTEAHPVAIKILKAEKNTVTFEAIEKTSPTTPDKLIAEFVDDNTLKLSKEGDPTTFLLKRAK